MKKLLALLFLMSSVFAQTVVMQPATSGNFRYKDITGQAFSATYISGYNYANAGVNIVLNDSLQPFLSGTVVATGLKPNFAYQIKLSGRPSRKATTPDEIAAADDVTNERLGRLGRWWRSQPDPWNADDSDFDLHKDDPSYIYEGYLLIAFFVTDENGNLNQSFTGNNSFHVLWRTDQRSANSSDGIPISFTLPATAGNLAYDVSASAKTVLLYGEHEPTRAAPGTLAMTSGAYRCDVVLTEESFHDFSALSGSWTTAMYAPVEFNIGVPSSSLPLEVTQLRGQTSTAQNSKDFAQAQGVIRSPLSTNYDGMSVDVAIAGVIRNFTLKKNGKASSRDGQVSFTKNKKDGSFIVKLKVSRANFGPGEMQQVPIVVSVGGDNFAGTVSPTIKQTPSKQILSYRKR